MTLQTLAGGGLRFGEEKTPRPPHKTTPNAYNGNEYDINIDPDHQELRRDRPNRVRNGDWTMRATSYFLFVYKLHSWSADRRGIEALSYSAQLH